MSAYKLLALDIDGTLLDSRGQVSNRTVAAIARARHAGFIVTLATGRSYGSALSVANAL